MARTIVAKLTPFNQFFLQYGLFLSAWNSFEILVEIVIKRELRLTMKETCIVAAGLGFGAKSYIAQSLLNRTEVGSKRAALIADAQRIAERNSFAHAFLNMAPDRAHFIQVRREVRAAFTVRLKRFSAETMEKHKADFLAKFSEMQNHFGITDRQLDRYARAIESFAPKPTTPAAPPLGSPTSSHSSKRQRRAQRRAQKRKAP